MYFSIIFDLYLIKNVALVLRRQADPSMAPTSHVNILLYLGWLTLVSASHKFLSLDRRKILPLFYKLLIPAICPNNDIFLVVTLKILYQQLLLLLLLLLWATSLSIKVLRVFCNTVPLYQTKVKILYSTFGLQSPLTHRHEI